MTQTLTLTSRISGVAMLMLAALPMAALATNAHAATTVKIGDLNLATDAGRAAFHQRAEAAGQRFCISERTLRGNAVCRTAVRAELAEKVAAVARTQTFAAR